MVYVLEDDRGCNCVLARTLSPTTARPSTHAPNLFPYVCTQPATSNLKFQQRWQLERSMVEGETRYDELEDVRSNNESMAGVCTMV